MGLIFTGTDTFDLAGPPEWSPSTFGLDQLVIPYRGKYSDLEAFLSAHPTGEASSLDTSMFLMQRLPDDHKQFPTVRMVYQGKRGGVPPPGQREYDTDRLAASSKRSSSGLILTQPMVVEYYAPTSIYTSYSRTPQFNTGPPPLGQPIPLTMTDYDTTVDVGTVIGEIVARFFVPNIVTTNKVSEIVPNQWWRNVNKQTNLLSPFIFTVPSGPFGSLYSPGVGYRIGDHVTFSRGGTGGGTMAITVTQVFVAWGGGDGTGGIYQFTVGSNTFTGAQTAVPGSGGSGTGAAMNIIIIP